MIRAVLLHLPINTRVGKTALVLFRSLSVGFKQRGSCITVVSTMRFAPLAARYALSQGRKERDADEAGREVHVFRCKLTTCKCQELYSSDATCTYEIHRTEGQCYNLLRSKLKANPSRDSNSAAGVKLYILQAGKILISSFVLKTQRAP